MPSIYVDIDLGEFETRDLIKELEKREVSLGGKYEDQTSLLEKIHAAFCLNHQDQVLELTKQLIYNTLGHTV